MNKEIRLNRILFTINQRLFGNNNESAEKGESAGTVVSKILAMEITKL